MCLHNYTVNDDSSNDASEKAPSLAQEEEKKNVETSRKQTLKSLGTFWSE